MGDLPKYQLLRQRERRAKVLAETSRKVEEAFQEFQEERKHG